MIISNSRVFRQFGFLVVMGLLLVGCDFSDKKGKSPDDMLHAPPYAGLTDSIGIFPDSGSLYAQRALLLSQHNHHELATPDYKKAWELTPVEPMALEYINNLLLVEKERDAVALLKECIATWPTSIDLRRRLSEIYEQTGQHAKAISQYDEILQSDSLNFEAWYNKGVLLSRLKDTTAAIDAFERSYALAPIYTNGITLAGFYAYKLDPRTPKLCDELIAKDVTGVQPEGHFIKGLYYSYLNKYDSALALFTECIRRDWRFADAHVEKGVILFDKKQYDEALKTFRTALSVANTNPEAYYWTARTYEVTGQKDLALLNYQRALALDDGYDEAREGIRRLK